MFLGHRRPSTQGSKECQNGRRNGVHWMPRPHDWLQSSRLARPGEPKIIPSRPHPPVRAPMVLPRERVAAQCGQKSPELLVRLNLNRQVTAMPKCGQNIVKYRACAISSPSLQEPGMAVVHRNEPQTPSTPWELKNG